VNPSPLLVLMSYMIGRARARARAALAGEPESGALTLEWMVIAALVAAAAIAAGILFKASIGRETSQLP
jgi:hypothetical protein